MRIFFACLLLIVISSVSAFAGPTAIQYQGRLTDSAGQPVPDGDYQITFSLYTSTIIGLPAWDSKPATVKVQGGVFTTSFAPPQAVFLENDNLWLEAKINSDTLPKVQLQTVPYSVRANSADIAKTVPDGSITTSKLALDVALARAQFVTGITSSLPAGLTMKLYLDNVQISGSPVLSAPYTESVELVYYKNTTETIYHVRPGAIATGSIAIRRPVSSDNTLKNLNFDIVNGRATRKTLSMVLMNGATEVARWTFANAWVRSYKYRIADDGLPVEEVEFAADGTVSRTSVPSTVSAPQQKYLQNGFVSGQPVGTTYQLLVDGTLLPDVTVASDVAVESEVILHTIVSADGKPLTKKLPGRLWCRQFTVRQNPMSNSNMGAWYQDILSGTLTKKTILLRLLTNGVSNLMQYNYAWPCSYTLRIADDGLPVEEYQVIYESVQ